MGAGAGAGDGGGWVAGAAEALDGFAAVAGGAVSAEAIFGG
jgi:hypothetical protein